MTAVAKRKISDLYQKRQGPWFARTDMLLEHVIRTQSTGAARNLRPMHFWRFLHEKSGYEEIYREVCIVDRKFADPIPILMHVDYGQMQKPLERFGVDVKMEHQPVIDLAECVRLGEVLKVEDPKFDFYFYLPKSGDVYQWNGSLYEIKDMKPEIFYTPLHRYIVWKGEAGLLRYDSSSPSYPIKALDTNPELPHPVWLR